MNRHFIGQQEARAEQGGLRAEGKHRGDSSIVADPTSRNHRHRCHGVDDRRHQRERCHATPDVPPGLPTLCNDDVHAASGSAPQTATIGGATVLTSAKGFTLYWFVPDTATTSTCNGSCATFWPPVRGPATAGPGVTGALGAIKRADGSVQATWNGHPLCTDSGDTAAGQAKGNGLTVSGGAWHEGTISGAAPAPSQSSSSGGGYGY